MKVFVDCSCEDADPGCWFCDGAGLIEVCATCSEPIGECPHTAARPVSPSRPVRRVTFVAPALQEVCGDCGGTGVTETKYAHVACVRCAGIGVTTPSR